MCCPLCLSSIINHYHQDKFRDYWQCQGCQFVFVKEKDLLNPEDEKAIYDKHQNNENDLGYRKFLNKLLIPLINKLKPGAQGLDFGCGPGPTVSPMLEEKGFKVVNYDLYYFNQPIVLKNKYDFIVCTEVIEHLSKPHEELTQLKKLLKSNGLVGIMTKRLINLERFKTWHYKNDLTHIGFYSDETFEYIAEYWGFELEFINSDTVILMLK